MKIRDDIRQLIETELLPDESFYVVDIKVSASRASTKIVVLMDSDRGILIDECAEISRKLGDRLEELNWLSDSYNLEVSSPGIDTPLTLQRQYLKNIGRNVKVILKDGKEVVGKLEAATESNIAVLVEQKKKPKKGEIPPDPLQTLDLEQIVRAEVQVSFK